MTSRHQDDPGSTAPQLDTEASHWLLRLLDKDPDPSDPYFDRATRDEAFMDWLASSPEHVRAFLVTFEAYYRLGQVDRDGLNHVQSLFKNRNADVIRIYGSEPPVPPAPTSRVNRRSEWRLAAGVAIAGMTAGVWLWNPWGPHVYSTSIGEQSTYKLDDGSMLYLNTASKVEVDFGQHVRNLRLLQGEALFVVEHDLSRPFIVKSGDAVVRAVGTQFNVRQRAGTTEVAVVEGVVQVTAADATDQSISDSTAPKVRDSANASPKNQPPAPQDDREAAQPVGHPSTRLAAGQEARVVAGHVSAQPIPAGTDALSWRQRRLIFRDASLAEVAAEFNRYNRSQIRVEGSAAQEKRLRGIFDADRPEALLLYSGQDESLAVEKDGNNWVIRSR